MKRARPITFLAFTTSLGFGFFGCTSSDESGKLVRPTTIFDLPSPDLRSDDLKITDFIISLEKKYKREEIRNAIDLHFTANGPRRIKIRLTYDRDADPTLASSIADSAIDLVKRLKHEDPSVRDIDIKLDREVVRREE